MPRRSRNESAVQPAKLVGAEDSIENRTAALELSIQIPGARWSKAHLTHEVPCKPEHGEDRISAFGPRP